LLVWARLRRVVPQHGRQRRLRSVAVPRVRVPLAAELQARAQPLAGQRRHQAAQDGLCRGRPARERRVHHRQQPARLPQLERQARRRRIVFRLRRRPLRLGQRPSASWPPRTLGL